MTTYTFQAECFADVTKLLGLLKGPFEIKVKQKLLPDCWVTLTTDATHARVVDLLENIVDAHVMLRTLKVV